MKINALEQIGNMRRAMETERRLDAVALADRTRMPRPSHWRETQKQVLARMLPYEGCGVVPRALINLKE